MTAKLATVYVKDVPPGVRLGLLVTSSRDEAARDALAGGPPDAKPVFIRNSNDHRNQEVHEFLTYIELY
jgi:hypothetical protein